MQEQDFKVRFIPKFQSQTTARPFLNLLAVLNYLYIGEVLLNVSGVVILPKVSMLLMLSPEDYVSTAEA